MSNPLRSLSLNDLSWVEVRSHLAHESRLIVPVGACDQFGQHLPIGSATLVADAVASVLSRDFGVLRAPAVAYGVNLPSERRYPGRASLTEKTLHRMLNDLIACWEDDGFTEFLLLTAHSYDPQVEAMASVMSARARIRVIELLGIDVSAHLSGEGGVQHGGEVMTSLMLYLCPEKVNLQLADDFPPSRIEGGAPRRLEHLPQGCEGTIGEPTLASAEAGERIFQTILEKIRARVFLAPEPA